MANERRDGDAIAAAFVIDRAEQYPRGSGVFEAMYEVALKLARGEHLEAWRHGELDDIVERLDHVRKSTPPPSDAGDLGCSCAACGKPIPAGQVCVFDGMRRRLFCGDRCAEVKR